LRFQERQCSDCNLTLSASKTLSDPSQNQTLSRAGQCLYRSQSSGIYYSIFRRSGRQIRRSLKTADKEPAKRRLGDLRQKVARLNTKAGGKRAATSCSQQPQACKSAASPLQAQHLWSVHRAPKRKLSACCLNQTVHQMFNRPGGTHRSRDHGSRQ
jgi:hypothetical protein